MSSSVAKTSKYSYHRASSGGVADVSIEYSADLTALSRLEVIGIIKTQPAISLTPSIQKVFHPIKCDQGGCNTKKKKKKNED